MTHNTTTPFYDHYAGQLVLAGTNFVEGFYCSNVFIAHMCLLMTTSTFQLWRIE